MSWQLAVGLTWLFVLGAALGSFLNVCILRLPRHEHFWDQLRGLWQPPSTCPDCKSRILTRDNIPIIGWLMLRGRCRDCQSNISPRYPLIELLNGLLFVVVYYLEVPTDWTKVAADSCAYFDYGPQIMLGPYTDVVWIHLRYLCHMVMIEALVVATFIDFDLRIIPDGATLPAMAFGVISSTVFGQTFLVPIAFQSTALARFFQPMLPEWLHWSTDAYPAWIISHPHLHGLAFSLAGLVAGGGVIWVIRLVGFWVLKREAMGFGDVVLVAMIGSFIGWQPVLTVPFLATICALPIVVIPFLLGKQSEIPFGPYLSLGTVVLLLGFRQLWPGVRSIFDYGPGVIFFAVFFVVGLFVCMSVMQLGKRLLGIETRPPFQPAWEWSDDWTAADQLAHFANERIDDDTGAWRTSQKWPGKLSGRGQLHVEKWRSGDQSP